jgi:hypothetical protein
MENPLSFGCNDSPLDPRTISSTELVTADVVPNKGKVDLEIDCTNDLCSQGRNGICTSCGERNGHESKVKDAVRLSEWWGYLMQKVLIDGNMFEGSSVSSGLHRAYKHGTPSKAVCDKYPLVTTGVYADLIYSFNTRYGGVIPQEILEDAKLHKIAGYYSVPVDPISIAKEITKGNVLVCRFTVGENTYTPSWRAEDLFPLRPPTSNFGGHCWIVSEYEGLDENQKLRGLNSWGRAWGDNGYFNFIFKTQKPYFTEAWAISDKPLPPKPFKFNNNLSFGMTHVDVKMLQKFLNSHGFQIASQGAGSPNNETMYFGSLTKLAVIKFQQAHNITPAIGNVFQITRGVINGILGV